MIQLWTWIAALLGVPQAIAEAVSKILASLLGVAPTIGGAMLVGGILAGCAGKNPDLTQKEQEQRMDNSMDRLEDANFIGDIDMEANSGGSPVGAHASQSFWLGPKDAIFRLKCKGSVDFTKPPRERSPAKNEPPDKVPGG